MRVLASGLRPLIGDAKTLMGHREQWTAKPTAVLADAVGTGRGDAHRQIRATGGATLGQRVVACWRMDMGDVGH